MEECIRCLEDIGHGAAVAGLKVARLHVRFVSEGEEGEGGDGGGWVVGMVLAVVVEVLVVEHTYSMSLVVTDGIVAVAAAGRMVVPTAVGALSAVAGEMVDSTAVGVSTTAADEGGLGGGGGGGGGRGGGRGG